MSFAGMMILATLFQVGVDVIQSLLNGLDRKELNNLNKIVNDISTKMNNEGISANSAANKLGYYQDLMSRFPNVSKVYQTASKLADKARKKVDYHTSKQKELSTTMQQYTDKASKINANQSIGERVGNAINDIREKAEDFQSKLIDPTTDRKGGTIVHV